MKWLGAGVLVVSLGGCALLLGDDFAIVDPSGSAGAGPGGSGGMGGGSAVRDVTGSVNKFYMTANAEDVEHEDVSDWVVRALVYDGDSFDIYDGEGHFDGTFTVPGVPVGTYTLELHALDAVQDFIVTSSSEIVITTRVLGRKDYEVASVPTPVTLTVNGMQPWADGDALQVWCAGAGLLEFSLQAIADTPPGPGDTQLSFTYDTVDLLFYPHLIDGVKGDRAILAHLATSSTAMGFPYARVTEVAEYPPNFTQTNGEPSSAMMAFTQVAATETLAFEFRGTEFEALAASVHPNATLTQQFVHIGALPGSTDYGFYWGTADVASFEPPLGVDTTDSFTWGNPFGSNWALHAGYSVTVEVDVALDGNAPRPLGSGFRALAPISEFEMLAVLAPRIGPVESPQVDGSDFFADGELASLTPLVAWDPPSLGNPTRYTLSVIRVYAQGGQTRIETVGRLTTADASVRVPPGLLLSGQTYVFSVAVVEFPGIDYATDPLGATFPEARSGTISGKLAAP